MASKTYEICDEFSVSVQIEKARVDYPYSDKLVYSQLMFQSDEGPLEVKSDSSEWPWHVPNEQIVKELCDEYHQITTTEPF